MRIPVALLGQYERKEFRPILDAVSTTAATATAVTLRPELFRDIHALLADDSACFDLILLLQSYPGEFTDSQIHNIRRRMPLCRFVLVAGELCEGEKRTGVIPSGVLRYYVHQWPSLKQELSPFSPQKSSLWTFPATATDEEILLQQTSELRTLLRSVSSWKKWVLVHSPDRDILEHLETLCRSEGFQITNPEKQSPELVVLDIFEEITSETQVLIRNFQKQWSGVQIFVLANAPRTEDVAAFLAAGAAQVLSKPFL